MAETYAEGARRARIRDPPTAEELKPAFKRAFRDATAAKPYFGALDGKGDREWWKYCVRLTMEYAGRNLNEAEFERCFRRIYMHYGSNECFEEYADVRGCLESLKKQGLTLGVTSNTATRSIETTLPILGLDDYFDWFACSEDIGAEKPQAEMYDYSLDLARFWCGQDLEPHEVLHVGDNLVSDYCGARASGLQALYLNRVGGTTNFQDWLVPPEYEGKCDEDILQHTIESLLEIPELLIKSPAEM